jgi:hypothetical protein
MAPLRLTVGSGCRRKEGQRFTTIPIRGDIVSFSHGRLRYGLANELLIPSTGVALVGPKVIVGFTIVIVVSGAGRLPRPIERRTRRSSRMALGD